MMRPLFALILLSLAACQPASRWGPAIQDVSVEELEAIAPIGKLSGKARPLAYQIEMDLDPRMDRFAGVVTVDVDLAVAATGLWMHGDDLDVDAVTVMAGDETLPATWTEVLETGVVWVGFPRRAPAGPVRLQISYSAPFDVNLAGLFRVDEQGNAYALAKSESIQARRFLPSFDEPGFKAPFVMALTIPQGMAAIGNTPVVNRAPAGSGYERVEFAQTRPLSTYLLSLAVGNFDIVERAPIPPNSVRDFPLPLTGYARAGKGEELNFALDMTPQMVRVFEEALQQPYPYAKLDIVAAPQWPSGATELAAAITYRESRILVNASAGPAFLRSVKEIHAHEIAHMWFGNLVTPPWWDDLWLKEGFATWGEPMALTAMEPEAGHDVLAVREAISAMGLDSLASARAVSEPIERNENIRSAYDAITYRKGLAVIGMADSYFGADVFRPALGQYIARFEDADADSADFFDIIGDVTGEPALTEAFQSFVTQSGVALVSAEANCSAAGAKVTLTQSQYRPLGSAIEAGKRWTIPVCIATPEGRTCTMMRRPVEVVALEGGFCPAWVHPNAGGTGYYRFDLGEDGWRSLVTGFGALSAGEALMALDSLKAGVEGGYVTPDLWLSGLDAAIEHGNPWVVARALNDWAGIAGDMPVGSPVEAEAAVVAARVRARLPELRGVAGADELTSRLVGFEGLTARSEAVRGQLAGMARAFIGLETSIDGPVLDSDSYRTALTIAIEDGGPGVFDALLAARSEIDDPVFEQAAAYALGAATDRASAAKIRQLLESGELGPRETYTLASRQMANAQTRRETWDWLRANFDVFVANIPGQWRARTPRLATAFCDEGWIIELDALFAEKGDLAPGHGRALAETREAMQLCAAQQRDVLPELGAALARRR